jgi:hypothetical protein
VVIGNNTNIAGILIDMMFVSNVGWLLQLLPNISSKIVGELKIVALKQGKFQQN